MNYSRLLLICVLPLVSLALCGFKSKPVKQVKDPVVTETLPTAEPEAPKPLDLSMPIKIESAVSNQGVVEQAENFVTVEKNKRRAIQLDGSILMSQELEAEKRKAVDGAGIVLKVIP